MEKSEYFFDTIFRARFLSPTLTASAPFQIEIGVGGQTPDTRSDVMDARLRIESPARRHLFQLPAETAPDRQNVFSAFVGGFLYRPGKRAKPPLARGTACGKTGSGGAGEQMTTVKRALDDLVRAGLAVKERRGNGSLISNLCRIVNE